MELKEAKAELIGHLGLVVSTIQDSDQKSFPETVKRVDTFYKQLCAAPKMCFVADSALYYNDKLHELSVDWLTRVPETYGEAKLLCNQTEINRVEIEDDRYKIFEYKPREKEERWLLVRSEPAFQRENITFLKRHQKTFDELQKRLWHCSCQKFNCEKDAMKALTKAIESKNNFYYVSYEITKQACFQGRVVLEKIRQQIVLFIK